MPCDNRTLDDDVMDLGAMLLLECWSAERPEFSLVLEGCNAKFYQALVLV